jgi:phage terminase large subunit-like protein
MEHGKITFNRSSNWNNELETQLIEFPSKGTHDDIIDSLAYIDQVSVADFMHTIELEEEWEPYDDVAGY